MPSIVDPYPPFSDGDTLSSSTLNQKIYNPTTGVPTSFEVLNGQLDGTNLRVGEKVSYDTIRPRSIISGDMVGLTGNLDFAGPAFTKRSTDEDAYISLPGTGITVYLPASALVIFTWQVGGANAIKFGQEEDGVATRFRFFLNGASKVGSRHIRGSRHNDTDGSPHKALRRPHRDRYWSGYYATSLNSGWHSAAVGVHSNEQTVRVRVRNMKAIWFY